MTPRRAIPLLVAIGAVVLVVAAVVSRPAEGIEVGVVVAVDARGLGDVRSFAIRTGDARTVEFRLGDLQNGGEFPPGHLVEHQATSEEIRVFYRMAGGERVAYRLEDAP